MCIGFDCFSLHGVWYCSIACLTVHCFISPNVHQSLALSLLFFENVNNWTDVEIVVHVGTLIIFLAQS